MLSSKQKKCVKMLIEGTFTQKEIAEAVKITEQTLCNWKKDAGFMEYYNEQIKQGIISLTAAALQTQKKLLNAKSEMVRFQVSKDILDRAGFAAEDNININSNDTVVIVDDIPRTDDTECQTINIDKE